jgi:hypothetical protein
MNKQTMCRLLTAFSILVAAGSASHAACKDEVATALERQRKTSGFSMKTKMLSEQGLVDMTVEYVLPNRMRQVITSTAEPKPVETIIIGRDGWSRMEGEDWRPLHPQIADAMAAQMQETLGDNQEATTLGDFECLGKQTVGDKQYLAYLGENNDQPPGDGNQPKMKPAAKSDAPKSPGRPVRVIYVDPTTGLPARSIFARANMLEKPIFEAVYAYPADIKIETPKFPGAPADKPADAKPDDKK